MKLEKKHINILYQLVTDEQQRYQDRTEKYQEDIRELEKILFKELEKQRDY